MEEGRLTRFRVGDILEPVDEFSHVPENEKHHFYYLVKRVTYHGTYDVENIGNGEKLYGMEMVFYRKIP